MLYWTEDFVECTLSLQAEKIMQFGDNCYGIQDQGIFQFDVCIEESLIHLIEGRSIQVVYRDHAYTILHFQEECQKIYQWFNVFGVTENEYKIGKPKRKRDFLKGSDGFIIVTVVVDNREYSPHI
jgi:hypothetical protein